MADSFHTLYGNYAELACRISSRWTIWHTELSPVGLHFGSVKPIAFEVKRSRSPKIVNCFRISFLHLLICCEIWERKKKNHQQACLLVKKPFETVIPWWTSLRDLHIRHNPGKWPKLHSGKMTRVIKGSSELTWRELGIWNKKNLSRPCRSELSDENPPYRIFKRVIQGNITN